MTDAFNAARRAATELHEELVAAGVDPSDPLALVEAAARRLDLVIEWLAPGDPVLKGAHALFDTATGTILACASGTRAERALVAAHEVGHAALHPGSSACAAADLSTRHTVGAYGARERRELAANVFARSLLLPPAVARRLHVEESLGARAIAARRSVDVELVRQQLVDALIPAPAEPRAREPAVPRGLDASQAAAVAHRGSPYQLHAGPGTGKTETLLHRIRSLLDDKIDPSTILALTYSARAAEELSERLARVAGAAADGVWIGTFHAFGLELCRRHHVELGLPSQPRVVDRAQAIDLLEEIVPTLVLAHAPHLWEPALLLKDALDVIARAKDELATPGDVRARALAMQARAEDDAGRTVAARVLDVAVIYEAYERELRAAGAVDLADEVMLPALLLERDAGARNDARRRHAQVLVDEYQDMNAASARLLRAIAGDGRRLWVVGDARQAIYRFRGACPSNMASFEVDYPGAARGTLATSYRSSSEITDCLGRVAACMAASHGAPLELAAAAGPCGEPPSVAALADPKDEALAIADGVEELAGKGVAYRDQAVLCRGRAALSEIGDALRSRGIPVVQQRGALEHETAKNLLALVSLAVDPHGHGLVRVAAMERYGIPRPDIAALARALTGAGEPTLRTLADATRRATISEEGRPGVARLVEDLACVAAGASPWEIITSYLFDAPSAHRWLDAPEEAVAAWRMLGVASEHATVGELLDRVRTTTLLGELDRLGPAPPPGSDVDGVRLMTVHASKGLEVNAVHVGGLSDGTLPGRYRAPRHPPATDIEPEQAELDHAHEEECLFFVAASRARTELRFYRSKRDAERRPRAASHFLEWARARERLSPLRSEGVVPDARTAVPAPRPSLPSALSASDVESYARCPRRFLFMNRLGFSAATRPTAFSQTHRCLNELVKWTLQQATPPDTGAVDAELAAIWKRRGPVEGPRAAAYWDLARQVATRLGTYGRATRPGPWVDVAFRNGSVRVHLHQIADAAEGRRVARRLRTGAEARASERRIGSTLFLLAARRELGEGAGAEVVHLSDGAITPIELGASALDRGREEIEQILAGIAERRHAPRPRATECARCPHLFGCTK